ncbi:MAG: lytic transglycosylase domain-containing protein [Aquificaceae bacterium]
MFDHCFERAGSVYGIEPRLLRAIAQVESSMKPWAIGVNKDGSIDIGLMQINSRWIKTAGIDKSWLFDPCYSAHFGAMVLRLCMDSFKDLKQAVDCYNKGKRASSDSEYVRKVMAIYEGKTYPKPKRETYIEPIAVIFGRF